MIIPAKSKCRSWINSFFSASYPAIIPSVGMSLYDKTNAICFAFLETSLKYSLSNSTPQKRSSPEFGRSVLRCLYFSCAFIRIGRKIKLDKVIQSITSSFISLVNWGKIRHRHSLKFIYTHHVRTWKSCILPSQYHYYQNHTHQGLVTAFFIWFCVHWAEVFQGGLKTRKRNWPKKALN